MERTLVWFKHPKFKSIIKANLNIGIILLDNITSKKFIVSESYNPIPLDKMKLYDDYSIAQPNAIKNLDIRKLNIGELEVIIE